MIAPNYQAARGGGSGDTRAAGKGGQYVRVNYRAALVNIPAN